MKKVVLILIIFIIPLSVYAYEGTITQSGRCGTTDADCHYDLYEDGHLEIVGAGQMSDYDSTTNPAPWGTEIMSLEMFGITSIGNQAFKNTNNLTEVTIPASVERIGQAAFNGSRNVENVSFQDGSNLKIIETGAFNTMPKLKNIEIPEGVTRIDSNFLNYSSVDYLVLPDSIFWTDEFTMENIDGLNLHALSNIKNVYCSEAVKVKCEKYFKEAEFYDIKEGLYYPIKEKADLAIYTADGDKFYANGKWYNSLSDMNKGNYNIKRIYTLEEAEKVSKKTGNTFKLRYK
ncbi:MAG: leucine-rich repeat domain-containing protein [Alphaproteobacteria bacterium]|nr:leucine-rich repeat domain-containing protein [Alphaproteobacteria bacterium]